MPDSNREDIERLETLYSANPGGRVFTHLAEAYRKAGDLDRALAVLEAGLQKHTDYASAHVVLGRVHLDRSDIVRARVAFGRVLELDPQNMVALRSLAESAAKRGDLQEALRRYRELAAVDRGNDDVAARIAELETTAAAAAAPSDEPLTLDAPPAVDAAAAAGPALEIEATVVEAEAGEDEAVLDVADLQPDATVREATAGDAADFTLEATEELPLIEPTEGSAEIELPDGNAEPAAWILPEAGEAVPAGGSELSRDGLVTETMGDLYLAQGLFARAVQVYRELLRHRPDDERLRAKLAGAESDLVVSGGAPDPAPESEVQASNELELGPQDELPLLEPEPFAAVDSADAQAWHSAPYVTDAPGEPEPLPLLEDAPYAPPLVTEPAVEDVESAWTGGHGAVPTEESLYGWTEQAEAQTGPTIADYFRDLLTWRPAGGSAGDGQQAPSQAPESTWEAPPPATQWEDTMRAAAGWMEPAAGPASEYPTEPPAPARLPTGGADEFDTLFGGTPAPPPAAPAAPAVPPATPAEPRPKPAGTDAAGDDEDLEMFRSWLQSLKR